MCGIAGILSFRDQSPDMAVLRTMGQRIRHRGPDDAGIEIDGPVGMAHQRLTILDLTEAAHQPMWDPHRRALLVFNGEIYNYRDIRAALHEDGVEVRSTGDTEVLLQACLEFGIPDCLDRLNGMFALAYWDAHAQALYLTRDRMGIKPLYYARSGSQVVFASEIKALLCVISPKPDRVSLTSMLAGEALWDPHTAFDGIQSVVPGEVVRFDHAGQSTSQFYFRLRDAVDPDRYQAYSRMSFSDITGQLEAALRKSISIHMISDVPVAMLASGGLDSSLIATFGHTEDGALPLYHANVVGPESELCAAQELSGVLGVPLRVVDLTAERYTRDMAAVTYHHEAPSAYHPNDLPFHLICRLAREDGVKVLLTGEGADELFLGYPWMIVAATRRRLVRSFTRLVNLLKKVPFMRTMLKAVNKLGGSGSVVDILGREALARMEAAACYGFVENPLERAAAIDCMVSCGGHLRSLLHRNDRMGMMESLESRIPFLENNLIGMAVNMPPKFKISSSLASYLYRHPYRSNKLALRAVGEGHLPTTLSRRRKIGFPVDAMSYFRIKGSFFNGGFLNDFYGITDEQMETVIQGSSADLVWTLFATEVFGRIFFLNKQHECVAAEVSASSLVS